ncbi:MAG: hypothetical protein Q7T20_13840 [Saprospiraceae bacterium]|nr:hypothetical protein [Saprospiraceae bacterium]
MAEKGIKKTDYPHIGYQKEYQTAEHRTPNFEGMYPYISVNQTFGFKKQSPVNYFIIRYWVFDIRYFITSTQYADSQLKKNITAKIEPTWLVRQKFPKITYLRFIKRYVGCPQMRTAHVET